MSVDDAALALTVVGREASWINADTAIVVPTSPPQPLGVLPYDRRESTAYSRATLTRQRTRSNFYDSATDHRVHDLRLRVEWPYDSATYDLVTAQYDLDRTVDLIVARINATDRSHGGRWLSSADGADDGNDDITVEFTSPAELPGGDAGQLVAVLTWTVTESVPRPA